MTKEELEKKKEEACSKVDASFSPKGDWIIKGVNGEFYPCKDDVFHKTYEQVEEIRE